MRTYAYFELVCETTLIKLDSSNDILKLKFSKPFV